MIKKKKPSPKQPQNHININVETTPILYTDNVHMSANDDGVVLNILQRIGDTAQMRIVSRIGMSRRHAKKLVQNLSKLLGMTEGRVQTGKKKSN